MLYEVTLYENNNKSKGPPKRDEYNAIIQILRTLQYFAQMFIFIFIFFPFFMLEFCTEMYLLYWLEYRSDHKHESQCISKCCKSSKHNDFHYKLLSTR